MWPSDFIWPFLTLFDLAWPYLSIRSMTLPYAVVTFNTAVWWPDPRSGHDLGCSKWCQRKKYTLWSTMVCKWPRSRSRSTSVLTIKDGVSLGLRFSLSGIFLCMLVHAVEEYDLGWPYMTLNDLILIEVIDLIQGNSHFSHPVKVTWPEVRSWPVTLCDL